MKINSYEANGKLMFECAEFGFRVLTPCQLSMEHTTS